ncbi:MAG: hypothetical protein U5R49_08985 [Deltaproteobacteria bacterium]|nr:hypothetical protein [Deltaproteobacteria bacterium]
MNRRMVYLAWLCFFMVPLAAPEAAGASRPQFLIKFATVAPEGSTWMKEMERLDQEIRKKSEGRLDSSSMREALPVTRGTC